MPEVINGADSVDDVPEHSFEQLAARAGAALRDAAREPDARAIVDRGNRTRRIRAATGGLAVVLIVLGALWARPGDDERVETPVTTPTTTAPAPRTATPELTLTGHSGMVEEARYVADDGQIATVDSGGTVRLWDAGSGDLLTEVPGGLGGTSVSPRGDLAVRSVGGTVDLIDLATGEARRSVPGTRSAGFSPDGTLVATDTGVWDADTGAERVRFTSAAAIVAFDARSERVAVVIGQSAEVWEVATGQRLATVGPVSAPGGSPPIALSADGRRVALGSGRHVVVWDAGTGAEVDRFEGEANVQDIALSTDGSRLATALRFGVADLWTVGADAAMPLSWPTALPPTMGGMYAIAISPDGRFVAGGTDTGLAIWSATSGSAVMVGRADGDREGFSEHLSFRADGLRIVTTNGGDPQVYVLPEP